MNPADLLITSIENATKLGFHENVACKEPTLVVQKWQSGKVATFLRNKRPRSMALEINRFWALCTVQPNGCWTWNGHTRRRGYGQFWFRGMGWVASRLAFALAKGYVPSLLVCHHCDNPPCINPEHLFEGSVSDNAQDMLQKGRKPVIRGLGKRSPLTDETVRQIKQLSRDGVNNAELARRFGVHRSTIRVIVIGKYWKDIA